MVFLSVFLQSYTSFFIFLLKTPTYDTTTFQKAFPFLPTSVSIAWPIILNWNRSEFTEKNFLQKIQHKKFICCEQKNNKTNVSSWKPKIYYNYVATWKSLWRFTASIIAVVYLEPQTTSKMELFVTLVNSFQTLMLQWTPSLIFWASKMCLWIGPTWKLIHKNNITYPLSIFSPLRQMSFYIFLRSSQHRRNTKITTGKSWLKISNSE